VKARENLHTEVDDRSRVKKKKKEKKEKENYSFSHNFGFRPFFILLQINTHQRSKI
jgi:hypothetical protein